MKTKLLAILLLFVIGQFHSQSEIINPHFSHSVGQGKVTKVELLDDATVLHFDVTLYTNKPCHIPSVSYIQPVNSDKKYFVTDSEGVVLDEEFEVHGKLRKQYKLIFPKLPEHVTHVKFDEFEHGTWEIHNLEIRGFKDLPNSLLGSWLHADGSNLWNHSFYNNKAIVDKTVYQYKSIEKKGKYFRIVLTKNGTVKTLIAREKDENSMELGSSKKDLKLYTTQKSFKNKGKFVKNEIYTEENLFKIDSATYAGVIASYSKASDYKTGTIHVNNVFTGDQESYLVEIKQDGSFRVKFPLYYPQEIYIRFPSHNASVFVEPGKETWNLIQSYNVADSFYAGDMADVNTQLNHFVYANRNLSDHKKLREKNTPADYKKICYKIHDKNSKALDSVLENYTLSPKTIQIMKLNLEYRHYENLISYEIFHERGGEIDEKYKTDSTYVDFLNPEILDNKLATITSDFSGFINRLRFSKHIKSGKKLSVTHPQVLELAEMIKEKGLEITEEEQRLVDSQLQFKIDNAEALNKQKEFREANEEHLESFNGKFSKVYQTVSKELRKNLINKNGFVLDSVLAHAAPLNITFSNVEVNTVKAQKNVLKEEEKLSFERFYTKELNEKNQAFTQKYYHIIREYLAEQFKKKSLESYSEYFGDNAMWVSDLIYSQTIAGPMKSQVTPLSATDLQKFSNYLKDDFVKQQLHEINNSTLKKIEDNQAKTGYVVNEALNTEADKVFEEIISKYKGKVVFIDFWATWCGPCRSAMTKMKPLKEELKEKDIVFVYITNQSSPENTYNNMIPDIKGEHYRVSTDQWNYLSNKFKISGIPHYTLVNKKGIVVKDKIPNRSNATLKNLFNTELAEQL